MVIDDPASKALATEQLEPPATRPLTDTADPKREKLLVEVEDEHNRLTGTMAFSGLILRPHSKDKLEPHRNRPDTDTWLPKSARPATVTELPTRVVPLTAMSLPRRVILVTESSSLRTAC